MSLFFVDSASELSHEQSKKLGVEYINLPYSIDNDELSFHENFDYEKLYSKHKKGVCINIVAPSVEKYIEIFEPYILQNNDIIYCHSSDSIVSTTNLKKARSILLEKYVARTFELIDSKNISIGQGIVSYLCAIFYRKGGTISEVVEYADKIKKEIALYLVLDSLEHASNNSLLEANYTSGTSLNVKPIVTMDVDGKLQLEERVSGKKKATTKLIEIIRQTGKNVVDYPIGIAYSGMDSEALALKEKLIGLFGKDANIFLSKMSPTTTALLGLNVLALAFHVFRKK